MSLLKWLNSVSKQRASPLLPTKEYQFLKTANRQVEKEITQQDIKKKREDTISLMMTRHMQK